MAYAKLLVIVNDAPLTSGGVVVQHGDSIAFTAESKVGWKSPPARWEFIDYPDGWTVPSGWTDDDGTYVYVGNGDPPDVTLPALPYWGKFSLRLQAAGEVDTSTILEIVSPSGFHDIARGEANQFETNWSVVQKQNLRTMETAIAGVGSGASIRARLVATSNLDLSGAETIDGVGTASTDIVLATAQTASEENGPYEVDNAGPWSRAAGATLAEQFPGMIVAVTQGDDHGDTNWQCTTNGPIDLDTDALTFVEIGNEDDKRKLDASRVDVKADYDAVGDGVADDTDALNDAAVAAASSARTLFIPQGTYRITSAFTPPSGVLVEGDGPASIIEADDAAIYAVHIDGETDVTIRRLKIGGTSLRAVRISDDAARVRLDNLEITGGTGAAGHACGVFLEACDGVTIDSCNIHDNGNPTGTEGGAPGPSGAQIIAEAGTISANVTIRNCDISNDEGNASFAVLAFDASGWIVDGNRIDQNNTLGVGTSTDSSGYGISFYVDTAPVERNLISNNLIQNCAGSGIYFQAGGTPQQQGVIQGNHIIDTALQQTDGSLLVAGIACSAAGAVISANVVRWTSAEVTADAGANTLTVSALNATNPFQNDDRVRVWNKGGAVPGNLSSATLYYVVNRDATSIKVALTSGGSAVDITTAGTGTHLVAKDISGGTQGSGIEFQGNRTVCSDNVIDGVFNRPAISLGAAGGFLNCDRAIVSRNQITNSKSGIYTNASVTIEGLVIEGNSIDGLTTGGLGIGIALLATGPRAQIRGNSIKGAPANGIFVNDGANCLIANNTVQACSLAGSGSYEGILSGASDSVILGNMSNGANHAYGIHDTGTYNVVSMNNCKTFVTGAVLADSSSFKFGNVIADAHALDNQLKTVCGSVDYRDSTGQNLGSTWTYPGTLGLDSTQTGGTIELTALESGQFVGIRGGTALVTSTSGPVRIRAPNSQQTTFEDSASDIALVLTHIFDGACSMDTGDSVTGFTWYHDGAVRWVSNVNGFSIGGLGSSKMVATDASGYCTTAGAASQIMLAGTDLTDADQTIHVSGGHQYLLPAATLSVNRNKTLGLTGVAKGAILSIVRLDVTNKTVAVINGGTSGGTMYTFPASTKVRADFRYDDASGDWELSGWVVLA